MTLSIGYHYAEEDFVKNTFKLSDIFGPNSLEEFKNETVKVQEVRSEQYGLCFSIKSNTSQTLKASQIINCQCFML